MKKFYPSSAVREADRIASEELSVPGAVLMENAGRGAAEAMIFKYPRAKNYLIMCGPGNNGGDGFVAARHLVMRGLGATVISTIDPSGYKDDALAAAMSAAKSGVVTVSSSEREDEEISALVVTADVIVDALLGTGSSGEPRGEVQRLIFLMEGARRIVSLDIPSGIDASTGEAGKDVVSAEMTVTFLAEKIGLALTPGAIYSGEVEVANIGVPAGRVLDNSDVIIGYDRSDISKLVPSVPLDVHKGARGGLMIIGGSSNYRGAPVLAARAALRAGCGLVILAIPDLQVEEANALLPEAIFLPLPSKDGFIRFKTTERIIEQWFDKCRAIAVGPGLGRSPECEKVLGYIHKEWTKPLLVDADALIHLANIEKTLYPSARRDGMLITPHAGEAAYLLGSTSRQIMGKRLASCDELNGRYGPTLLKGPRTLIFGDGEKRVILEGGPGLAVPGSGDILTGIIGAYLAAGLSVLDAATLGALVHAEAGRRCGRRDGILAREIADNITTEDSH
ncbi:MAG: NAD(P)H-hydrate dehydratase [Synergistaceae bacterium]|jgi:NAD(P)H-hydrate epimerase|nr:NAD(P)H-hydrate dehydratase [Synergistaceae bacterium]